MNAVLRELIALSLLLGLALYLCPEGSVRQVLSILSAALLGLAVLKGVRGLDYDAFALDTAKLHEAALTIGEEGERAAQRLERLYIEDEYTAYVQSRAEQLGLSGLKVELELEWAYDGLWVPHASRITGSVGEAERETLGRMLREELGIPTERQYWNEDG